MAPKRKRANAQNSVADEANDTSRPPKRKRAIVVHEPPTSEEVHSARQLRQLLTFQQDLRQARHGLQSFKDLLDGIVNEPGEVADGKLQIVSQFLEITKPREADAQGDDEAGDQAPVYLSDIMEMWSMATQMSNENVMSAVAVVLALLLRVLSSHVDLVPAALGISRTVLQQRQLELLSKNLSADKGKDFIISPTLRLLREMICLDGGALASAVFRARSHTFKSLARNMGLRFLGDGIEDLKRPSVRTNAVRTLLSSLKFLPVEAKRDLLVQRDIPAALMRGLKDDPPYLVFEVLNTLRTSVLLDQKLSRDAKIRVLNSQSLTRIASLYHYQHELPAVEGAQSVEQAAHDFLLAACTTTSAGILRNQQGYYPDGVEPDIIPISESTEDGELGLESILWMDQSKDEISVRNTLLSDFIQTLRPWSSAKQNELLVAIFGACPELVVPYFENKKAFNFDPKLSATWIGYSTLLFSTIQLEVPQYFGHHKRYAKLPPPTSVVLGNILPLPLELKSISRCLNQKSSLISFFAIRLLVIALEKLSTVLKMYGEASSDPIWGDAARSLVNEFCQRTPSLKDIIGAYRGISDDDLLQRVAASRLLLLHHEVIPQGAVGAKFDFSPMLSAAIKRLELPEENTDDASLRFMELENLFAMAQHSPNMRWCVRGKDSPQSPFITLMKLYIERVRQGASMQNLRSVLDFVAEEQQLVEKGTRRSGLRPLLATLQKRRPVDPAVWSFLDNCAERCSRSPIKYLDMAYELAARQPESVPEDSAHATLSPLILTMAEQLLFLVSDMKEEKNLVQLSGFISDYLGFSQAAGVSKPLINAIFERFSTVFGDSKAKKSLKIADNSKLFQAFEKTDVLDGETKPNTSASQSPSQVTQSQLETLLSVPIKTDKDNSALMKWTSKTAEEFVEDGYASSLVWLLASEHPSIRKETLTSIAKMAAKIKESSYGENEQVWLLLSELVETSREHVGETPISNIILAFVSRALDVLKDPMHRVYPKLNTFLTRGPIWDLDKIPLAQNILQEGPTEDEAYYSEISWILGYFLDGLRTTADVAMFRKRNVFQRLVVLFSNPNMGPNLRNQILRIVYRTTSIEGGSDTLITRFGFLSWLREQAAAASGEDGVYLALVERLWATCDKERIAVWSKGSIDVLASSS